MVCIPVLDIKCVVLVQVCGSFEVLHIFTVLIGLQKNVHGVLCSSGDFY